MGKNEKGKEERLKKEKKIYGMVLKKMEKWNEEKGNRKNEKGKEKRLKKEMKKIRNGS